MYTQVAISVCVQLISDTVLDTTLFLVLSLRIFSVCMA